MRRGKADRWERMADNMNGEHVPPERLAYELRWEHRAVVRMVKQLLDKPVKGREIAFPRPMKQMRDASVMRKPIVQIYNMACRDILDRLKARAQ